MRLKISPKTLKPSHISLLKLPERFRNDKQHATSNEHHSLPKLKNKILKSLSLVLSFPLPYALSPTLSPSPLSPLDSPFYSSFFQAAPLRYGLLWQWRVSMLRWVYVSYAVVKVAFVFFVGCWLLWLRNLHSLWWQWCIFMEYGCNDPRKSASHICAIPQKDQSLLRLLVVVNKAQFNPVNTRCGTHHTPTHITQSIKLGYHNLPHLNP